MINNETNNSHHEAIEIPATHRCMQSHHHWLGDDNETNNSHHEAIDILATHMSILSNTT